MPDLGSALFALLFIFMCQEDCVVLDEINFPPILQFSIHKHLSVYLANKTLDLPSVEGVWWGTHPKEAIEEKNLVTKH